MSNLSLNFWCVCLLSVPLPEWQEKKTLNFESSDISASFFIYNFNLFDGLHTISKLDNQQHSEQPYNDSNFQVNLKALLCLIATINCHSCSQAKDKTEIQFFVWEVENLFYFSFVFRLLWCQCVFGAELSRLQSQLTTILRNGFNLFLPSQMEKNPIGDCAHDFDLI